MSEDQLRRGERWLTVVGALPDGTLAPGPAREAIAGAGTVFGSARLLEAVGVPPERRAPWPSPLSDGIARLLALRGGPVAVVATGDPMHFGIGATLSGRLPADEMRVLPAPSAFSLAAARLGWPLEHAVCASLHDRPIETLHRHLSPGRRIIVLTRDGATPAAIARLLVAVGLGQSRLVVLEQLAGPRERILEFRADDPLPEADPLNTVAIECRPDPRSWDPEAAAGRSGPGLPDDAFRHDGQLTKADVRAITLAALAPRPGEHLWDIGAGSGSVAIEWCRSADGATASAFESDPERLATIEENRARLGAAGLSLVAGDATETVVRAAAEGARPDAVFLGGAVADETLFAAAWDALVPGGRFVSNAVTLEGEAASIARHARHGGSLRRISIEIAAPVGGLNAFRPKMAVVQWRARKEGA